jgi:hypothetical protein
MSESADEHRDRNLFCSKCGEPMIKDFINEYCQEHGHELFVLRCPSAFLVKKRFLGFLFEYDKPSPDHDYYTKYWGKGNYHIQVLCGNDAGA